jgi:D-glycero-alpha-D-manno-heptose 1-phosphate guanylyltransferase
LFNEAIILAGGFGTRLQTVVSDVPKPMAPVNGEPFLNYQLNYLKHYGIKKVIFSVGYLHETITSYYKNHFNGLDIEYSIEDNPLGTGGGIRKAITLCKSNSVLVLNGDSFFEIDLHAFSNHHYTFKSDFTLALRKVDNSARYGTIELSVSGGGRGQKIISFKEKNGEEKPGLINAGIYALNTELYLKKTKADINFSIEKDFFEAKLNELDIYGLEFNGYFIDIGIPEDYSKAQNEFKEFKYK